MNWRSHHKAETISTNLDARAGKHGDVFTADFQTAGRGRLDHKWLSAPGENLMMSAVLDVGACPPEQVATLPLVVGLAVIEGLSPLLGVPRGLSPVPRGLSPALRGLTPMLKWPNDVLVGGRKLAGILCERHGDQVIVGIGVNVGQTSFPREIGEKATSLKVILGSVPSVAAVRDAVLAALGRAYAVWREGGLAPFLPQLQAVDCLRGRTISVRQTDDDGEPLSGFCEGIAADGSLIVAGRPVYAGEAHVTAFRTEA